MVFYHVFNLYSGQYILIIIHNFVLCEGREEQSGRLFRSVWNAMYVLQREEWRAFIFRLILSSWGTPGHPKPEEWRLKRWRTKLSKKSVFKVSRSQVSFDSRVVEKNIVSKIECIETRRFYSWSIVPRTYIKVRTRFIFIYAIKKTSQPTRRSGLSCLLLFIFLSSCSKFSPTFS